MALPIEGKLANDGNRQVVELFERALARAKEGNAQFGLWIQCDPNDQGTPGNHFDGGWQGGSGYDFTVLGALLHYQHMIVGGGMRRVLPPSFATGELDASYCFHNLAAGAMSFDFTAWLVTHWMQMMSLGGTPPLKVCFGYPDRPYQEMPDPHSAMMFENVVRPMVRLIGGVETNTVSDRFTPHALYKDVSRMARQGVPVPTFSASGRHKQATAGYRGCVTITMRECDYWKHRNNNMLEWLKFAHWLQKSCGERVVFVRDTRYANELVDDWETCPSASADLELRMALYEGAKCNCFVSNGPWNLALFSDVPWMMFVTVQTSKEFDERDTFTSSKTGWWETFHGVKEGGQFPWSNARQRIVWENDTYERMKATWRDFFDSGVPADTVSAGSMLDGEGMSTDGFDRSAAQSI